MPQREEFPNCGQAFLDRGEIGPTILATVSKKMGLQATDLWRRIGSQPVGTRSSASTRLTLDIVRHLFEFRRIVRTTHPLD